MIIRKSVNTLQSNAAAGKLWEGFQPTPVSRIELNESKTDVVKNYKGMIKLAFGIIYFLSLVSALTILLI